MPKVKLASQQLSGYGSGNGGQLSPTLLSGSISSPNLSNIAASIRAPQVHINSGNVEFTPVRPPDINVSTMLSDAAKAAEVWSQSALQFQDRENQVRASDAVLRVNEALRDSFHGGVGPDGKAFKGYESTEGIKASDDYEAYVGSMQKSINDILSTYGPEVRQHAVLRISEIYNAYMNKAANHRAEQLKVEEKNIRDRGIEGLMKDGANDPDSLFRIDPVTGVSKLEAFASKNSDSFHEKQAIEQAIVTNTFDTIRFKEGMGPVEAFNAASKWFKSHADSIPEVSKTDMLSKLSVMEDAKNAKIKADQEKAEARARQDLDNAGGGYVQGLMLGGQASWAGPGGIIPFAERVRALSDNPVSAENDILNYIKSGYEAMAHDPNIGYEAATTQLVKMLDYAASKGNPLLRNVASVNNLREFAESTVPSQLAQVDKARNEKQEEAVSVDLAGLQNNLYQQIDEGASFSSQTDVLRASPGLAPMSGDTAKTAKRKQDVINNLIQYSNRPRTNADDSAQQQEASEALSEMKAEGVIIKNDVDFEAFLREHGVVSTQGRAAVRALYNDINTTEGNKVNSYKTAISEQISLAFGSKSAAKDQFGYNIAALQSMEPLSTIFHPGSGESKNEGLSALYNLKKTEVTPEEQNLQNRISEIAEDTSLPPRERIARMRKEVQKVIDEANAILKAQYDATPEGKDKPKSPPTTNKLDQALQVKAADSLASGYLVPGAAAASRDKSALDSAVVPAPDPEGEAATALGQDYINSFKPNFDSPLGQQLLRATRLSQELSQ